MTLRRKLLLAFLGTAVLPIAAVAVAVTWGTIRSFERRCQEDLAGRLEAIASLIDRELNAESNYLDSLVADMAGAYAPPSESAPRQRFTNRVQMEGRLGLLRPYSSRFLLLERGRGEASVLEGRLAPGAVIFRGSEAALSELPDAYRHLPTGHPEPAGVTVWRGRGPALALISAISASGTEAEAFLVEELSAVMLLEDLWARHSAGAIEDGFVAALDHASGRWRYLYHTNLTRIGLPVTESGALAGLDARGGGEGWLFRREGDRLDAAGLHPSTGWRLGASLSLAPRLAPIRRTISTALLLFALMAALIAASVVLVTRGIGGAVKEIASSAEAMARGDLDRTVKLRRADEFGAIAEHVNQMARDLLLTAESRSIARLSARMVHDLKGVASQLNLMVHSLREHYDDAEFRAEAVGLIEDLAGQVESLALGLRHGGSESEPIWETVDLDALAERVVRARLGSAWPDVAIARELQAPGGAVANEELLSEALGNVVVNAVEAMEGAGTLRLRTGRLSPERVEGEGASGPTHFIEVQDSGPGMSPEFIQEQLFRPFSTTKAKGIGLGMYHARQAIERLGGRIEVWSRPGEGTRVRIEVGGKEPAALGSGEAGPSP